MTEVCKTLQPHCGKINLTFKNYHSQSKGLQGLARGVLGVDIVKTKSIRCGNWETEKLSEEQVKKKFINIFFFTL